MSREAMNDETGDSASRYAKSAQQTLSYQITLNCPIGGDVRQAEDLLMRALAARQRAAPPKNARCLAEGIAVVQAKRSEISKSNAWSRTKLPI